MATKKRFAERLRESMQQHQQRADERRERDYKENLKRVQRLKVQTEVERHRVALAKQKAEMQKLNVARYSSYFGGGSGGGSYSSAPSEFPGGPFGGNYSSPKKRKTTPRRRVSTKRRPVSPKRRRRR
jgi:uncharacterized membrane protein